MVVPPNTPKWSFLVGKPMVVGYHHFRKPSYLYIYIYLHTKSSALCTILHCFHLRDVQQWCCLSWMVLCDGIRLKFSVIAQWHFSGWIHALRRVKCLQVSLMKRQALSCEALGGELLIYKKLEKLISHTLSETWLHLYQSRFHCSVLFFERNSCICWNIFM